jgi:hypothetical protein
VRGAPEDAGILDFLLTVLLRRGDYAGGEKALAAASAVPPADVACMRVVLLAEQDRDDASRALLPACEASTVPALVSRARSSTDGPAALGDTPEARRLRDSMEANRLLQEGDFAAAETLCGRLLEQEPWNAALRACYAMSLLENGKGAAARRELTTLFEAEAWITIHGSGGMSGVITKRRELALNNALEHSLALLVRALADAGELADARTALRKAEARFGRTPTYLAEGIHVTWKESGTDAAWTAAPVALRSWPTERAVLAEVGQLVFAAAGPAPDDVLELLVTNGDPTVVHNTVGGLANARDPRCARFAAAALPRLTGDEQTWARGIAYRCALDIKDLGLADTLVSTDPSRFAAKERLWHAWLLYEAGRLAEAEALVRPLVTATDGPPDAVRLLAQIALDQGDKDTVQLLSQHPLAPPLVKFNAAVDLFNDGRFAEAKARTAGLDCAAFGPNEAQCRDFLEVLAEPR